MFEVTKFEIHPEVYHTQIDYRKSLIDMIVEGNFPANDEDITVKSVFSITVPDGVGRIVEKELRVVSVSGSASGGLIDVRDLCKVVHEHGFYPSGIEDLVAFGVVAPEYVDSLREGLVALGSQCEVERRQYKLSRPLPLNVMQSQLHCPALIYCRNYTRTDKRERSLMKKYMRGRCLDSCNVILISRDL